MNLAARGTMAIPFLALMVGIAVAQEQSSEAGWSGHLVLGGAALPDYEGSEDYMPAPFAAGKLAYDDYYIETRGLGLRANLLPTGKLAKDLLPFSLEAGPSLNYRGGRDDVENDRVDDLRDIDGTIEMGAFAKISTEAGWLADDQIGFEVEFLTDVGGEHDGTTITFGPSYSFFPAERWRLGVDLSATWASGNYTDTYFGIDARDAARSGLDTYDADVGIKDVGLSVNLLYQWNEHWGVTGMAGISQLVGDAADSPIVEDEGSATQGIVAAGLVFRF